MFVRLTIGVKIFGMAAVVLALMVAESLFGILTTDVAHDNLNWVVSNYVPAYRAFVRANVRSVEEADALRRLFVLKLDRVTEGDDQAIAELTARIAEIRRQVELELGQARRFIEDRLAHDDQPRVYTDVKTLTRLDARLDQIDELRNFERQISDKLLGAINSNNIPLYEQLRTDLDQVRDRLNQKLDVNRAETARLLGTLSDVVTEQQHRALVLGISILALAFGVGLALAGVVTRSLVRPLHRLVARTEQISQGLPPEPLPVTSTDEVGRLTVAYNHMVEELRIKTRIKETFGKYVDPRIVAGLIDRPDLARTQGERREMTILFCDMMGFTRLSEALTPVTLVNVLNTYFTEMSKPVRDHDGVIDKFIGDAIMAYWGPPFNPPQDQVRLACLAALGQLERFDQFGRLVPDLVGVRRGLPQIGLRVGIATGDVIIGNIGSDVTKNYTAMGETVNLASRIEGINKYYGTRILITEATARQAEPDFELREIDRVTVAGKDAPVTLYELLALKGALAPAQVAARAHYGEGLVAFRERQWDQAARAFRGCLEINPEDGPSATFLRRIELWRSQPPAEDWTGTWCFTEK